MTAPTAPEAPAPSLLSRLVGVIFSPRATFEHIVRAPKVLGAVLAVGLVIAASQVAPQVTESGRQAAVDAAAQQTERFTGRPLNDEEYARLQKAAPYRTYGTLILAPVFVGVGVMFFSLIYFVVFNVILGGTATFRQVAAVTAHAAAIGALGALLAAPVQYFQGTVSSMGPFTLGALLPMLDETSFLARFLGFISVFSLWGVVVTAIGFSVLYRRKTSNIAVGLLCLTALFATVGATVMGFFSRR